ncbi:GAF domain-containing sensor histidine kinase [Pedobacter sp. PWIIR3]
MNNLPSNIANDIRAIQSIDAISTILDVICRTTEMGFAAVARVTEDRWVTCAVLDHIEFGLLPGSELELTTTICNEISHSKRAVVIDHVKEDPEFREHHTPLMYGFQSYISMPIIKRDGSFFGTLCAIDPKPAKLKNPAVIGMFELYADLISLHLDQLEELGVTQKSLAEEKQIAELREQFIAILGHDLRNPVGAVRNVGQLLKRGKQDEANIQRFAEILLNSSHRMTGLIENMMDFARGRLGSGIVLNEQEVDIKGVLEHVIDELRMIWPNRDIVTKFQLPETLYCDGKRIAQLFSNLLSNALSHGNKADPVVVNASSTDGFELSIENTGTPIPQSMIPTLFEPFSRANSDQKSEGLGLGLYISSEIARASGGHISVHSDQTATKFIFKMPVGTKH